MNAVTCKLYITQRHEFPSVATYELQAVCRGEANKDWAQATPGGSMTTDDAALDTVWAEHRAGTRPNAEVYVTAVPDPAGDWRLDSVAFQYGGCKAEFNRNSNAQTGYRGGKLALTINARPATLALRTAYADSLILGEPATFRMEYQPADD